MKATENTHEASRDAGSLILPETAVEYICRWLSIAALVTMLVVIITEVVSRGLFSTSWEGTDEYGGYLLVALTFLSLPVTLARGGYHQMEVVRMRLSERNRVILDIFLNVIALLFVLVLVWQFVRLELSSWNSGETSMTSVRTPLWLPRGFMMLGSAALSFTLLRFIAGGIQRLRKMLVQG